MANKTIKLYHDDNNVPISVTMVDNGDGTFAEKVSASVTAGATTIADGGDVAQGTTTDVAWVSGAGTVISLLKKMIASGTGGGPATVADGADVAQGTTTDASSASTVIGLLKKLASLLPAALVGGRLSVDGSGVTQPVSASALPLPTGASTETSLAAVLATAGATTGAAVVTDANGTMQQYLRGLVKLLITSGTIVLGAGTNAIGKLSANANVNIGVVGGTTVAVTDVFTRPADTTAYAVGDAVSATVSDTGTTVLRGLTVAGAVGGTGYITKIRLWTDQATCVAAMRLQLFTVQAPATAIPGDNVAMILSYGNFAQRVGSVDLPAFASEAGTNTAAHATDVTTRLAFQCDPADTKLYYRLSTQTAFTPANAQSWSIEIVSERNGT